MERSIQAILLFCLFFVVGTMAALDCAWQLSPHGFFLLITIGAVGGLFVLSVTWLLARQADIKHRHTVETIAWTQAVNRARERDDLARRVEIRRRNAERSIGR